MVFQQRLNRSQAQNISLYLLEELFALIAAEDHILLSQKGSVESLDGSANAHGVIHVHHGVHLGEELALDACLEVSESPSVRGKSPFLAQLLQSRA
jgi:hypothetical protein